jgi:hypothetical protein
MNTTTPNPDPGPENVADEVEQWLQAQTPVEPEQAPAPLVVEPETVPPGGETKRVLDLRAEVAEAHLLLGLQSDEASLLVDTLKVRKRRKQGAEAARLHALAQNPAVRAWQASRWRLVLTWVAVFALVLALGWSTAGVQAFASEGAAPWSPGWAFAWLVEPFLSLALLTVVSARAFMATRGQPLNHPTLKRIEWLFLGLTLGMNAWPHLPLVASTFYLSALVLHILGPIVAVAIVTALPIIWGAFADLDHGGLLARPYSTPTGPKYRQNVGNSEPGVGPGVGATTAYWVARARELIDAGQLDWEPSATQLRKALGCGTPVASEVRDELKKRKP